MLVEAIDSVRRQSPSPSEIVVVVDHNEALLERLRGACPDVVAVANAQRRGLSGARNTGVQTARGDVIAFLDDDAHASEGWLGAVEETLSDERVIGVGGPVHAGWQATPPQWFPEEFLWVVGCSFRGQPDHGPVRNPIGANMAFRRAAFERAGGFADALARTSGSRIVSCDETEFSIRVRRESSGTEIVMAPRMQVVHHVPSERTTWSYFRTRCFGEGYAKALVARSVGAGQGLATERSYVLRALTTGALRALRDGISGDLPGFRRAGAIVAGLCLTTAGYLRGLLAAR